MSSLDECTAKYLHDLEVQTHCCVLTSLDDSHKAANRKVFDKLVVFQRDIDAKGTLPFRADSADVRKKNKETAKNITYPENALVLNHRELKKIMPIPDIHKTSDCDIIYRFLIARRFDINLATQDILYYLAFREKYNLNQILWDRELEATFNGLDGEELLRQTMDLIAKKLFSSKPVKIPRQLLNPGWGAWCCGLDKVGHVLFYQRPGPKELAQLEKRWRYVEGQYDCRNPDFHAVTAPYSNLLVRLYLRIIEKGRRLARLLNFEKQYIIREDMQVSPAICNAGNPDAFADNGGGMCCMVDVGLVRISHLTSSKCKDALRVFRMLSMMSQSYYPENMRRLIIVNAGFVFNMLFKLVKPWLDPQTQRKIILLSSTNKMNIDQLNSSESPDTPVLSTDDHSDDDDSDPSANNTANFALRNALEEYIPNQFIPSWYGGKLAAVDAPLCYGDSMPKQLSQAPHFNAAVQRIKAKILPELLPDNFLFSSSEEGAPISKAEWDAFREHWKPVFLASAPKSA